MVYNVVLVASEILKLFSFSSTFQLAQMLLLSARSVFWQLVIDQTKLQD